MGSSNAPSMNGGPAPVQQQVRASPTTLAFAHAPLEAAYRSARTAGMAASDQSLWITHAVMNSAPVIQVGGAPACELRCLENRCVGLHSLLGPGWGGLDDAPP